jgi:hypothetical protein
MNWIVPVSADERAVGILSPETERAALAILKEHGCLLLRGAFERDMIDTLYREFTARYGSLSGDAMREIAARPAPNPILEVGETRFEITTQMTGPFGDPALFANPLLTNLLARPLGEMRLSSFTTVVSYPGAAIQHTHRDHNILFDDTDPGLQLPVYAINCSLPLIDVDAQTGPTALWPGSHRWPSGITPPPHTAFSCPFERGDCILMDYRTLHTGLPNRGTRPRPILYMVYARPWFFDDINHLGRTPLDMPLEVFAQMPLETRPLLSRAHTQAMRVRWHESGFR